MQKFFGIFLVFLFAFSKPNRFFFRKKQTFFPFKYSSRFEDLFCLFELSLDWLISKNVFFFRSVLIFLDAFSWKKINILCAVNLVAIDDFCIPFNGVQLLFGCIMQYFRYVNKLVAALESYHLKNVGMFALSIFQLHNLDDYSFGWADAISKFASNHKK